MSSNATALLQLCRPTMTLGWFTYVCNGILNFCCLIFGTAGSIYSFEHLYNRITKMRMVKFLMVLCIWDMALLITTFGFYGLVVLVKNGNMIGKWVYFYIVCYPLQNIAMTGSMWMVLLITYERYRAVAHPFRQRIREMNSVILSCGAVALGALLVNVPTALELTISSCTNENKEDTEMLELTWLRYNRMYSLVYRVIIYLAFNGPGPFVAVLLLSIKILSHRRSAYANRVALDETASVTSLSTTHSKSTANRDPRTTLLLTVMILKFLLCHTAPTLMNIAEFVRPQLLASRAFAYLADLSNILVIIHSATNWIIFAQWRNRQAFRSPRKRTMQRMGRLSQTELNRVHTMWSRCRTHFMSAKRYRDRSYTTAFQCSRVLQASEHPEEEKLLHSEKPRKMGRSVSLNLKPESNMNDQVALLQRKSAVACYRDDADPITEWVNKTLDKCLEEERQRKLSDLRGIWQKELGEVTQGDCGKENQAAKTLVNHLLTHSNDDMEREIVFKFAAFITKPNRSRSESKASDGSDTASQ